MAITEDEATASSDPPWPYEPGIEELSTMPTWECPEGLCACHPPAGDEQRHEHVIVFYDPQGNRMPGARCRVYEKGALITEEPTKTDPNGELTLRLRASTSSLRVEWAPPELPLRPSMPYWKRYHLRLARGGAWSAERRLANLGFSRGLQREDNVRDYQRAYGHQETGNIRDVEAEVTARHDDGQSLTFSLPPPPATAPSTAPPVQSFFAQHSRPETQQDGASAPSGDAAPARRDGSSSFERGESPQGAVGPEVAHVVMIVALEPATGPLNLGEITARLRPRLVPNMKAEELESLVRPTKPGVFFDVFRMYAVFEFKDVPLGTYDAVVHIANVKTGRVGYAMGRTEVDVRKGPPIPCYVGATVDRPILTVADPLLDLDVPQMQRRRKVLATIFRQFPQSADFQAAAKGIRPPYDQGTYKPLYAWDRNARPPKIHAPRSMPPS